MHNVVLRVLTKVNRSFVAPRIARSDRTVPHRGSAVVHTSARLAEFEHLVLNIRVFNGLGGVA